MYSNMQRYQKLKLMRTAATAQNNGQAPLPLLHIHRFNVVLKYIIGHKQYYSFGLLAESVSLQSI